MRTPTSPSISKLKILKHPSLRRSHKSGSGSGSSTSPPSSPISSVSTTPKSRGSPPSITPGTRYVAAAEGVVEASLALEEYVRTAPDPTARNGSRRLVALLCLFLSVIFIIPTLPFFAIRYYTVRPGGFRGIWSYLFCRGITIYLWLDIVMPSYETNARRVHGRRMPLGGLDKIVTVTPTTIPPVPDQAARPPMRPVVSSIPLPGFMLSPPGTPYGTAHAEPGEKIILYFHGGGYVSGHPLTLPFAFKIARDTKTRVFAPTYRKVLDEKSGFPAPLVDAYAAWDYVLALGFAPHDILLMGDSAGGHLCMYLAQGLAIAAAMGARINPSVDPAQRLPGGIALCSPWLDLTLSSPSWEYWGRDYIFRGRTRTMAHSALRNYRPDAAKLPILSPALAPAGYWRPFANVQFFVSYGYFEAMGDEIKRFVKALRHDGVKVRTFEEQDGLHCGPIAPWSVPSAYTSFANGVKGVLALM